MHIEMSSDSDRGLVRERNEDCVLILPEHRLAILSDGMGGHRAGDVASSIAVDVVAESLTGRIKELSLELGRKSDGPFPQSEDLCEAIEAANEQILQTARTQPECYGMGATIVVASLCGAQFLAAHLGDSRAYRLRGERFEQLTEDHTLAQQYLRDGGPMLAQESYGYARSMLLRGLGIAEVIQPDITTEKLAVGDVFLLCSDGLTDAISDKAIRDILLAAEDTLDETVASLIAAANDSGGPDNISVALMQVRE